MQGLSICRIDVHEDRMVCEVQISPGASRMSNPRMAAWLLRRLPTLRQHACVNDKGTTFSAVMDETSLPHVLEHVAIDLQVRADDSPEGGARCAAYVGVTEWVDERAGVARVSISYTDDLVALRALRDGAALVNEALAACV